VFSLVYAILLRPFPYADPDRLVRIQSVHARTDVVREASLPDAEEWRRRASTLQHVGAYTSFDSDIRGNGPAEPVRMAQVDPEALAALGVAPALGRLFLSEENRPGGDVQSDPERSALARDVQRSPGHHRPNGAHASDHTDDRRRDAGRIRLPGSRGHL
jgi:hypothetical protein